MGPDHPEERGKNRLLHSTNCGVRCGYGSFDECQRAKSIENIIPRMPSFTTFSRLVGRPIVTNLNPGFNA
jgi:hypothetical protein